MYPSSRLARFRQPRFSQSFLKLLLYWRSNRSRISETQSRQCSIHRRHPPPDSIFPALIIACLFSEAGSNEPRRRNPPIPITDSPELSLHSYDTEPPRASASFTVDTRSRSATTHSPKFNEWTLVFCDQHRKRMNRKFFHGLGGTTVRKRNGGQQSP